MKKLLLLYMMSLLSMSAFAQKNGFEEGMKKGFDAFNEGEAHKDWVSAAESLVNLAKEYETEWLSYYWAGYMYTQIARAASDGVNGEEMLDKAQQYLDLASNRIKDKTAEQEVDFHMLQDKDKFKKLGEVEMKAAMRKDPENPLLLVGLGLDLFFRGDYQSVFAARILLLEAKEKFSSRLKPRHMSTHYVEQWVGYWEPQSQKKILELTEE